MTLYHVDQLQACQRSMPPEMCHMKIQQDDQLQSREETLSKKPTQSDLNLRLPKLQNYEKNSIVQPPQPMVFLLGQSALTNI